MTNAVDLATALLKHGEDKDDPMIPLLIWYGIEPVVAADPAVGMQLAKVSKMPKVTEFIYRRLGAEEKGRLELMKLSFSTNDQSIRFPILVSLVEAARRGEHVSKPEDWTWDMVKTGLGTAKSPEAAAEAMKLSTELAAIMGDPDARAHFRSHLTSSRLGTSEREKALQILTQAGDTQTAKLLQQTVIATDTPASLRRKAIQALASLKDSKRPHSSARHCQSSLRTNCRMPSTRSPRPRKARKRCSRPSRPKRCLRRLLSPFLVRQLTAFDDAEINALIKSAWGDVNAPKADLGERTKKYRDLLTPAALAKGDLAKGKMLYTATCGQCHKLFGEGQNVGPDITGSNRADLNYLLENVLDPNAVIGKAYQLNLFTMKDGRVMSGVIKDENPAAVKIAMMGGVEFTLPQADIAKREVSKLSTMPEGLFDALQPEMVVDLGEVSAKRFCSPAFSRKRAALKAGLQYPERSKARRSRCIENRRQNTAGKAWAALAASGAAARSSGGPAASRIKSSRWPFPSKKPANTRSTALSPWPATTAWSASRSMASRWPPPLMATTPQGHPHRRKRLGHA
jgi:putative heme-binding domain-containing protein